MQTPRVGVLSTDRQLHFSRHCHLLLSFVDILIFLVLLVQFFTCKRNKVSDLMRDIPVTPGLPRLFVPPYYYYYYGQIVKRAQNGQKMRNLKMKKKYQILV